VNRREALRVAGCFFLALLAAPVAADVQIGHDAEHDFTAVRTYAWDAGTPAAKPEVQAWIVEAVDRELQAKGLRRVEGQADVRVSTVAYAELDVFTRGNYVRLDRYDSWGVITSDVVDKSTGNLMVDLIDPATGEPVWRGVAREGLQANKLARSSAASASSTSNPPTLAAVSRRMPRTSEGLSFGLALFISAITPATAGGPLTKPHVSSRTGPGAKGHT
jgi:hypothetical protein